MKVFQMGSSEMVFENRESVQLLNTAIIKCKEKKLDPSFEERLAKICQSPAIKAIESAIANLSESERISRDQAALQLVETFRDLESIWNDYVLMEGISNLKGLLKGHSVH
jgi:hypothetical protein